PALRGPPLRLRRQGRLPGSADRLRAEAAGHGAGGARVPQALRV
ncbi:MAG: UTP--glucose-1-phosphate uridylyltransferase, partial [uncultured Acetobacteraceae bacterium]